MKKKLLIYILVLIFLYFVGCINEMEMLEDNSTLKAGNERLFMPDSLRDLIEYDRNSMDQYSIRKLENILELLYTFPETNKMLNSLKDGLKVKMEITGGSSSLGETWYDPIYPPKIGFLREDCITMENVLHELLHHYAMYNYVPYRDGVIPACEEYEVRVLTDVIMQKYCANCDFKYQGMSPDEGLFYQPYIDWINNLINTSSFDKFLFGIEFKKYGTICIMNLQYNDKTTHDILQINDLNYYIPLLLETFLFNFKR